MPQVLVLVKELGSSGGDQGLKRLRRQAGEVLLNLARLVCPISVQETLVALLLGSVGLGSRFALLTPTAGLKRVRDDDVLANQRNVKAGWISNCALGLIAQPAVHCIRSGRQNWSFGFGSYGGKPLIHIADQDRHLLSFWNIAELHVLGALRRYYGSSPQKLRRTSLYLEDTFESSHLLLTERMLTDGVSIFIEQNKTLVNATKGGQMAMRQLLGSASPPARPRCRWPSDPSELTSNQIITDLPEWV